MALAALDWWALQFDGEDHDLKLDALCIFIELIRGHSDLEALRFLDEAYDAWFWTNCVPDPSDAAAALNPLPLQDVAQWLGQLRGRVDHARAAVSEETLPLETRWRAAVVDVIRDDASPQWRDPIVCIPKCRHQAWPSTQETALHDGRNRLLVVLESPAENALFERDFDPWLCERARANGEDANLRDLPRPVALRALPMRDWRAVLSRLDDCVSNATVRLDFLPENDWDPCIVDKATWRDCPFGPHREKGAHGRKKGPADRRGRIWDWDDATHRNHWDVQHENQRDQRYMNVRPDGTITRHYGD